MRWAVDQVKPSTWQPCALACKTKQQSILFKRRNMLPMQSSESLTEAATGQTQAYLLCPINLCGLERPSLNKEHAGTARNSCRGTKCDKGKSKRQLVLHQSGDQNLSPDMAGDQWWEHEQAIFLRFLISYLEVITFALPVSRTARSPRSNYIHELMLKNIKYYTDMKNIIFCFGLSHELVNDIEDKGYTREAELLVL